MLSRLPLRARHFASFAVVLTAALAMVTTSLAAAMPAAHAESLEPAQRTEPAQTMLVIGDSYSSYYGGRDSRHPGWWALLGADLGLEPVVHAMSGTGFISRGSACNKPEYRRRLDTVRRRAPQLLFVEGGRNDWRRCTRGGRQVESTRTEIATAVDRYFAELAEAWDGLNRPRTAVYVVSPWGQSKSHKARVIRPIIRDSARAHGFTWVHTRRLSAKHAPDGIHPNKAGSRILRDQMLSNSDLSDRLARD